jgi:hypothetical protein
MQGPESKQKRSSAASSSSAKSPGDMSPSSGALSSEQQLQAEASVPGETKAQSAAAPIPSRPIAVLGDAQGSSVMDGAPSDPPPPMPNVPTMEQFAAFLGPPPADGNAATPPLAPPNNPPKKTAPKSVAAKVLGVAPTPDEGGTESWPNSPTSRDRYPGGGENSPGRPVQRFKVFARVDTPVLNEDKVGADSDVDTLGLEYDVETTQRMRSDSMTRKSSYHANAHLELISMAASVATEKDGSMMVGSAFQGSMAFTKRRTDTIVDGGGEHEVPQEELTEKAVAVIHRVVDKLTGLDFQQGGDGEAVALPIPEQIDHLIKQATSNENLSTCFIGWCAFW